LTFLPVLRLGMSGSFLRCDGIACRHHRSPAAGAQPAGQDPGRSGPERRQWRSGRDRSPVLSAI